MGSSYSNQITLYCSYCHQDRAVETGPAPLCPECDLVMAYQKSCERCLRDFWAWPNQKTSRCKDCRIYHKCYTCDNKTENQKCNYCTFHPVSCACCRFEISWWSFHLYGRVYCQSCGNRVREIIKDRPISTEKEIEVTYEIVGSPHHGYCSDPDEFDYPFDEIKRYFPLMTDSELSLSDYQMDGLIPSTSGCNCSVGAIASGIKIKDIYQNS